MSSDNYMSIVKVGNQKYVARNCFSECEGDCLACTHREVFTARGMIEAVHKAEEEMANDIYEYGYRFKNI